MARRLLLVIVLAFVVGALATPLQPATAESPSPTAPATPPCKGAGCDAAPAAVTDVAPLAAGPSGVFNSLLAVQVATNGRFNMGAQPDPSTGRASAQSYDLLFRWPNSPGSSYTTIRLDGQDFVYGTNGVPLEAPRPVDDQTNRSAWRIGDIEVSQILQLAYNPRSGREDIARIEYRLRNLGAVSHSVGTRLMLDTEVNNNDGAPFRVPGVGIVTTELDLRGAAVPDAFQVYFNIADRGRVANATLRGDDATPPDRLVIGAWPGLANSLYAYNVTAGRSITTDSAFALYWEPQPLAPGAERRRVAYYGLAQLSASDGELAVALSGPTSLSRSGTGYTPSPFSAVATVENNSPAAIANVQVSLGLGAGLALASGQATQSLGSLAPGARQQVSWNLRALPRETAGSASYEVSVSGGGGAPIVTSRSVSIPAIPLCGRFAGDLNVPDGSTAQPGASFDKGWRVVNCGAVAWGSATQAVRIVGSFGPPSIFVGSVAGGADARISTQITAPTTPGIHRATYRLQGATGFFGDTFWVEIVVPQAAGAPIQGVPGDDDENFIGKSNLSGATSVDVPITRYFGTASFCFQITLGFTGRLVSGAVDVYLQRPGGDQLIGTAPLMPVSAVQGAQQPVPVPVPVPTPQPQPGPAPRPQPQPQACISSSLLSLPQTHGILNEDGNGRIDRAASGPQSTLNSISIRPRAGSSLNGVTLQWAKISTPDALRPLVFVHGWAGGYDTFKNFYELAKERGLPAYPVEGMYLGYGVLSDGETIGLLNEHTDRARVIFGVRKVNLIAHSRGGIISRLLLEDLQKVEKVDGLVTISSPHQGLGPLSGRGIDYAAGDAWLSPANCEYRDEQRKPIDGFKTLCIQAGDELKEQPMRIKNYGRCVGFLGIWFPCSRQYEGQLKAAKSVNFRAVSGGVFDINHETATYPWLNSCSTNPRPGAAQLDGTFHWPHTEMNKQSRVFDRAVALLKLNPAQLTEATCGYTRLGLSAPALALPPALAAAPAYQTIERIESSLGTLTGRFHSLSVAGGEELQVSLLSTAAMILELRTPTGATIAPTALPSGVTFERTPLGEATLQTYTLPAAAAGAWQALISGASEAIDQPYTFVAAERSTVRLEAAAEPDIAPVGAPVRIIARLLAGDTPRPATLTATLEETGESVTMSDDGQGGDQTAGDGRYSATLPPATVGGYSSIRVRAVDANLSRVVTAGLYRYAATARVTAIGAATPEAPDGDGRWQSLSVPVTVEADEAGEVQVRANLRDSAGQVVASAIASSPIISGTQELLLRFNGLAIHDAGRDGPFTVTDLSLQGTIANEPTYSAPELTASVGSGLRWQEFTGQVLRLTVEPAGRVERGSGAPSIVFSASLATELPGTYGWTATLVDADGAPVLSTSGQVTGEAGNLALLMRFAGPEVNGALIAPPLRLGQLIVWRQGGVARLEQTPQDGLAVWNGPAQSIVFLPLLRR